MPNNKDTILNEFVSLMWQKGYDSASMSDLALATQLRKASIYHHFVAKNEMLDIILSDIQDKLKKEVLTLQVPILRKPIIRCSYLDRLKTFAKNNYALQGIVLSIPAILATPKGAEKLKAIFDHWLLFLEDITEPQPLPDHSSNHILAQFLGACILARLYHDQSFIDVACNSFGFVG